jgi:crotonobetainyl-CoA:carnitine CoA-transferase CaiB-like acyl-CoA transferase
LADVAGILGGHRVVELADGWSGAALCSRLLAELGAEVIKVEPREGDSARREPFGSASAYSGFELIGAGKRSVVADPSSARDRDLIERLCLSADVVVDGLQAAGLGAFGLQESDLRRGNPRLVYCAVSEFGASGPIADWARSDLLAQAMSGMMASTGFEGGPPTKAGVPLSEHVAALIATASIFAALRYREREGEGQAIDIAAQDCLVLLQSSFLPRLFVEGSASARQGYLHPLVAPWDRFEASDGDVLICVATDEQWAALLEIVGRAELAGDPRYATPPLRRQHVEEVTEIVAPWARRHSLEEIVQTLEQTGIPAGPIVPIEQLHQGEHFRARELLVDAPRPDGTSVKTMGSIFRMSRTPGVVRSAAQALGEDSERILEDGAALSPARRP